ncbi:MULTISPECIES: hypothetical protein [Aquimarina]|uniref:Uncharacterized protein n=1 Tax=Aquimarina algiphila TaxID=2047982 RepID=A0A554VQ97_9FLAO|nr:MULTISPECIES: hypothetical protein [Aquimarina]TSE10652.1 hypothetical protein FOF46_03470 [Aquimarina algiphila]
MEEQYKNDIQHLVKEAGLESPSANFMNNIMKEIEVSSQKSLNYTPLISKKTWLIVALVIVSILGILLLLSDNEVSILHTIDFSFLKVIDLDNPFSDFTLHKTTLYGILFLALLFFVQIPILKRRIDSSF